MGKVDTPSGLNSSKVSWGIGPGSAILIIPLVAILTLVTQPDDKSLGPDQFVNLIGVLRADLQDVSLVFEGERYRVRAGWLEKGDPEELRQSYQGTYGFRSNSSAFLDVFQRNHEGDILLVRNTHAILDNKRETLQRIPDLKHTGRQTGPGVAGSLFDTGSPERILFLWYFTALDDPGPLGYEFQGWENIDGHSCARVQIGMFPKDRIPDGPFHRFWIDMKRGGHPLKYEFHQDGLHSQVDKIQLAQVKASDGKVVWLPVKGEYQAYSNGKQVFRNPLFRETYSVVGGSIRLNQDLPDEVFSVDWDGPLASTPELDRLRRETKVIPKRPVGRTDPIGVQERLEQQLAEADRQSKRLEASSAAREVWGWTSTLQVLFGSIGVFLIGGVVYWKWSGR